MRIVAVKIDGSWYRADIEKSPYINHPYFRTAPLRSVIHAYLLIKYNPFYNTEHCYNCVHYIKNSDEIRGCFYTGKYRPTGDDHLCDVVENGSSGFKKFQPRLL